MSPYQPVWRKRTLSPWCQTASGGEQCAAPASGGASLTQRKSQHSKTDSKSEMCSCQRLFAHLDPARPEGILQFLVMGDNDIFSGSGLALAIGVLTNINERPNPKLSLLLQNK